MKANNCCQQESHLETETGSLSPLKLYWRWVHDHIDSWKPIWLEVEASPADLLFRFLESTLILWCVAGPGKDKRRKVFNLTCFTLWKCPEHNRSTLSDKCYSQSDLSEHNAPLLDSLSKASATCWLGLEQVTWWKHFHSTWAPSNQTKTRVSEVNAHRL